MTNTTNTPLPRIFIAGLYAMLFTPLLVWHDLIYPFITLKLFGVQALTAILVGLWLTLLFRGEVRFPRWSPVTVALALYFGALLVSAATGVDPLRSVWSTQERGMGIIMLLCLGLYALMLASARDEMRWGRFWLVSLGVSAVAALFTFVHMAYPPFFFDPAGADVRPGSFLGNPTFLAGYLLPHIFIGLWLGLRFLRSEREGMAVLVSSAIVADIIAIFLTQTRGALIGLLLGFLSMALYGIWRGGETRIFRKVSLRMFGIGIFMLLIAASAGFWFTRSAPLWQAVPGIRRLATLTLASPEIAPRLTVLGISMDAFRERPLFGFGFENFKYAFESRYDPTLLRQGYGETYFDKPHNIVLEYATTTGGVGLAAYLGMLIVFAVVMVRTANLGQFAPFGIGLLAANLGQNLFVFDTFGSYLTFFAVAGFLEAEGMAEKKPSPVRRPLPATLAVHAAAVLIALAGVLGSASIVYANHLQYEGFNFLANRMAEQGLAAYDTALAAPVNPYRDAMLRDRVSVFSQAYAQGLIIPNLAELVPRAVKELMEVVKRHPNDYALRVTLADALAAFAPSVHERVSFLEEGKKQIVAALELSPSRQEAYFIRAKLELLAGDPDAAVAAMTEAVRLDPEVGNSHLSLALIAFEAGRTAEGFAALETAERLGRVPEAPLELRVVANQYADAGNYAKAIQFYRRSLELASEDPETLLKLGIVYFYAGDRDAARVYIRQAAGMTDLREASSYPLLKPMFDDLGIDL